MQDRASVEVSAIPEADGARRSVSLTAFQAVVISVTLGGAALLLPEVAGLGVPRLVELVPWVVLVAIVELLPVPVWHGLQVSLGFPLLMVVAFLYPPVAAALAALVGSFDPREFRREVGLLLALFNRCQVALAVFAASSVFHALGSLERSSTVVVAGAAVLAAAADYLVNVALVGVGASIKFRLGFVRVLRQMRIGRLPEFLVSYLALGLLGLVVAQLYLRVGFWSVPAFVLPLLFARQMFFRSRALEEAHRELQDREAVLRALSNRMAEERQEERAAIAAYLHDDLAQILFRLSLQVDVARRHLAAGKLEEASRVLEQIKETRQQTSDRIRALIRDLHRSPLGPRGLAEAVQGFIAETARDSGVRFHTDISDVELPPPIALLVYHIAREGVMNALKHARASNVWVTVGEEGGDAVQLVIRDDGVGFDPEAPSPDGHFGLAMMRERATVGGGTFDLRSAPGRGTTITVRFPTGLLQGGGAGRERSQAAAAPAEAAGGASPGTPEAASERPPREIARA